MPLSSSTTAGIIGVMRLPAFIFTILGLSAGRLTWDRLWVLLGLLALGILVSVLLILRRNPALLAARFQDHADTKPFDRLFAALTVPTLGAFLALAGLDGSRYHWSTPPAWSVAPGVLLHILGYIPIVWVLSTNPHAEGSVRIQADRGHRVISSGPYRYVRHPMYSGMLLMFSGWPLILGSLWAYLPFVALSALLVWRTGREDQTLQHELAGYREYATVTRYRLLPHIW